MYVVLGATGHVGSAVLEELLAAQKPVLAICQNEEHAADLEERGADVARVDIMNSAALSQTIAKADRIFVLNPPGNVSGDSVRDELNSIHSIVSALRSTDNSHISVASVLGAREGQGIGDLGVLFQLEQDIRTLDRPTTIGRAAYYFTNWAMELNNAKTKGKITSLFPKNFQLPMIHPSDIGHFHAQWMLAPIPDACHIFELSGPRDYTVQDVADAFGSALHKKIEIEVIPENKWMDHFKGMGFSDVSAESYCKMTKLTLEHTFRPQGEQLRGTSTLEDYVSDLVSDSQRTSLGLDTRPIS